MNLDKYFPLFVHLIVAGTAIGWAWGLRQTGDTSLVWVGVSTGLAAGLGFTGFLRCVFGVL